MRARWIVVAAVLVAGCASGDLADRYRAERALYHIEAPFVRLKLEEKITERRQWRQYAAAFEAIAVQIPARQDSTLRVVEGRAWMRAAECHFAALDSGRAELLLANLAASDADLPPVFGEVSLLLGRNAEREGQYLSALGHYRDVVEVVAPDPGPDPTEYRDPDALPEEETANDFVLALPLRMARLAARDTTLADPGLYYARAREYYGARVDDPSPFVRVESNALLAETEADQGEFARAVQILRELERHIPYVVRPRRAPEDVRLQAFGYVVQSWVFGRADADSAGTALEELLADYPVGTTGADALLTFAKAADRLGRHRQALEVLDRLRRDHPTATVVPEAELLRARIEENQGDWLEAQQTLRTLSREFPTSRPALRAPLEIAAHHRRTGDPVGEAEALDRAEQTYREVMVRYPGGAHSFFLHEMLVQTLTLQGRDLDAIEELIAMCDGVAAPAQRPALLVDAARRAETRLGQPARAADILERVAEEFPDTRIGRWSLRHARRLRAANSD